MLFRRFHAEAPAGAVVTAALLCTDHRWRKASHHLIAWIVDLGLLARADEVQLAEWFTAPTLGVELEAVENVTVDGLVNLDADGLQAVAGDLGALVVERSVLPPLRRWAAARLVAEDPTCWQTVLDAASALPSRDGAALAAGVMDATAHLAAGERPEALLRGWPPARGSCASLPCPRSPSWRAQTLRWLALQQTPRRKFERGRQTVSKAPDGGVDTTPAATVEQGRTRAADQASLF